MKMQACTRKQTRGKKKCVKNSPAEKKLARVGGCVCVCAVQWWAVVLRFVGLCGCNVGSARTGTRADHQLPRALLVARCCACDVCVLHSAQRKSLQKRGANLGDVA